MTTKSFKIPRIVYVIIALSLAFLLFYLFSMISKGTEGPLKSLFSSAENAIESIEDNAIIKQLENRRIDKLAWFDSIRNNKQKVIHSKRILFGASDNTQVDSYESIINLEDSLGITFPIIHIYKAWGEKQEHQFPMIECKTIYRLGSIPMITWEPWVGVFTVENFPKIKPDVVKRDKGSLASIARGDYDAYIIEWANKAKEFGHPFYLRFGHEMNDPYHYPWGPQNNQSRDYINAWRHVYNLFKTNEVTNIIWVWNPHLSYSIDEFYPGNAYVDIISFGVLNFGTSVSWSKWWTFEELLSNSYAILEKYNKPMMISEFGSLIVGGDRNIWFTNAYANIPTKYHRIKSIVFFHYSNDKTTDKSLDWQFIDDKKVIEGMKNSWAKWDKSIKQPDM
jgi:beta-mannanase